MDEFELTRRILSEPGEDPAGLDRVHERLREAIDAEQRRLRSARWRRVLPIAAALGVAIVTVVAVIVPTGRRAAAEELRNLGRIASRQEPLVPGRGEYLLIRSEELRKEGYEDLVTGISFDYLSRLSISTWLAADGSGFRREEERLSGFATEADRRAWIEAGSPRLELSRTDEFRPGEALLLDVTGLPPEPDRLLATLRSGSIAQLPPGDDQVFILIGELLAQGNAQPGIRQALFEVAARLEEVELVGTVEDPLGRSGVGVSLAGPSGVSRLVFDEDSAELLAIELYQTGTERLVSWTAALPTVVVEEAPQLQG